MAASSTSAEDEQIFIFGEFGKARLNLLKRDVYGAADGSLRDFVWCSDIDKERAFFTFIHFNRFVPRDGFVCGGFGKAES